MIKIGLLPKCVINSFSEVNYVPGSIWGCSDFYKEATYNINYSWKERTVPDVLYQNVQRECQRFYDTQIPCSIIKFVQ